MENTNEILQMPVQAADLDMQLTEEQRQRWIWAFERLKSADIAMTLTEKVKAFCEATSPEEIDHLINSASPQPTVLELVA